jgi:hypothetical protein
VILDRSYPSEKAPKMTVVWKQGRATKDWFADYRGLSARVRVDPETGKATEISWYISGKVDMVSPNKWLATMGAAA